MRVKMGTPKRGKCFSIEEKSAVIQRLKADESNVTLAKGFGVFHSTISTRKKSKSTIKDLFNADVLNFKRIKKSTQVKGVQALLQLFKV